MTLQNATNLQNTNGQTTGDNNFDCFGSVNNSHRLNQSSFVRAVGKNWGKIWKGRGKIGKLLSVGICITGDVKKDPCTHKKTYVMNGWLKKTTFNGRSKIKKAKSGKASPEIHVA